MIIITASKAKNRQFESKLLKNYIDIELHKISDSIYAASGQGLGFTHYDLYVENFRDDLVHDVVTYIYNALTNKRYNYEVDIQRQLNAKGDCYRLKITWHKMNKD